MSIGCWREDKYNKSVEEVDKRRKAEGIKRVPLQQDWGVLAANLSIITILPACVSKNDEKGRVE